MFLHEVDIIIVFGYMFFMVLLRTKRNSTIYGEMQACKGQEPRR